MAEGIYVDLESGGAPVIKVDGVCYSLVAQSNEPPSMTGGVGSFDNCADCETESSSSTGSTSPEDGTCPCGEDCPCCDQLEDAGNVYPPARCCYQVGATATETVSWNQSNGDYVVYSLTASLENPENPCFWTVTWSAVYHHPDGTTTTIGETDVHEFGPISPKVGFLPGMFVLWYQPNPANFTSPDGRDVLVGDCDGYTVTNATAVTDGGTNTGITGSLTITNNGDCDSEDVYPPP